MPATLPDPGHLDRRAAIRYLLSLPVTAQLAQANEPVAGMSRNISVRGIYFTIDQTSDRENDQETDPKSDQKSNQEFAPGSVLDLSFTLPAEITQGTEVFVRAQGRVMRVEKKSDFKRVGVAMCIDKYEVVRAKPVPA
jgi:hypothetical protein